MAFESILVGVRENLFGIGFDAASFTPNVVTALLLIFAGLFLGKFTKWIIKTVFLKGLKLGDLFKYGFGDTFLTAIKWTIYIIFLQAAISALKIPVLSDYLGSGLAIIPGLVGAIILIIIGYAIAVYLKNGLAKTKVRSWQNLGDILYIFVMYLTITLAIRTAFISHEELTNNLILIITAIGGAALAWSYTKQSKKK